MNDPRDINGEGIYKRDFNLDDVITTSRVFRREVLIILIKLIDSQI